MDALAAHAFGLIEFGVAFADIGERFHATWQGLAAFYQAPEVGQLLAATAPVAHVSAAVGEDYQTVGGALGSYAAEVRQIQARLDALRARAGDFEASVDGDDDWADDDGDRERSNELLAAVNTAMADFHEAERRCANAINALYGGQQYSAPGGDGGEDSGEYGPTAEQYDAAAESDEGVPWGTSVDDEPGLFSTIGHGVLDVGGLVPVIGEPLDGINAAWYAAEGDYTNAALSAAAMVPIAGWGATGAKAGLKGADVVKGADDAVKYTRPSNFRSGVRDQVWHNSTEPSTGRVRDPVTGQFMSQNKPWDMGHRPGYEFHKHQRSGSEREIPRRQFLDEHNNPSHYRPELPNSNRHHGGEDKSDAYFGP